MQNQINIDIVALGSMQIKETKQDGTFHRYCLHPGQSLTGQPQEVIDVATATWTPEVIQAYQDSLPPEPTPEEKLQAWRETTRVGPLQLRRALRAMEEMETINNYMNNLASDEVKEAWEYATVIPRLDPLVEGLQGILERTDEEVDQLFELALTFP